jgi:hypothetical protein
VKERNRKDLQGTVLSDAKACTPLKVGLRFCGTYTSIFRVEELKQEASGSVRQAEPASCLLLPVSGLDTFQP